MYKERLDLLFSTRNFDEYVKEFNELINNGEEIGMRTYLQYALVLTRIREFDKAYEVIKKIEKNAINSHLETSISRLYLYAYKVEDAEKVLKHKGTFNYYDCYLYAKILLLKGDIEGAREYANKCLQYLQYIPNDEMVHEKAVDMLYRIWFTTSINGNFECEYNSFIKNGNKLEPGHIVFLKSNVDKINGKEEITDKKSKYRPYMIWKIDNNRLYMFPVAVKRENEINYVLYKQDYPNSGMDRIVKDNLCETSIDNVVSVQDKVRDEDYYSVLKTIFKATYFSKNKEEKEAKEKFMKEFVGEVYEDAIISSVNPLTKESKTYYVNTVYENEYLVFEYNHALKKLNTTPIIFKDTNPIIKVFETNEEELKLIKEQVPEEYKNHALKKDFRN